MSFLPSGSFRALRTDERKIVLSRKREDLTARKWRRCFYFGTLAFLNVYVGGCTETNAPLSVYGTGCFERRYQKGLSTAHPWRQKVRALPLYVNVLSKFLKKYILFIPSPRSSLHRSHGHTNVVLFAGSTVNQIQELWKNCTSNPPTFRRGKTSTQKEGMCFLLG